MKARQFWISVVTAATLGLTSIAAVAQDRTVNCDVGQSLQDAINKAQSSAARLVLNVKGTCYETVRFSRDRLIIDGGDEAVIHGALINWGAHVTVRNIGITGPGVGMRAATGRTRLINVHFYDNEDEGLSIIDNGTVVFRDGSIRNSGLEGVAIESGTFEADNVEISGNDAGIEASMARITLENTNVVDNAGPGIDVTDNSALRVSDGIVSRNATGILVDNSSSLVAERVEISWQSSSGVGVRYNSTASFEACSISNNGQSGGFGSGLFMSTSSSAIIDSTEIFANSANGVLATGHNFVILRGATAVRDNLGNGIALRYDSGAIIDAPTSIPPNGSGYAVNCLDTESSLDNRSSNVGLTNCTGFDSP